MSPIGFRLNLDPLKIVTEGDIEERVSEGDGRSGRNDERRTKGRRMMDEGHIFAMLYNMEQKADTFCR